MNKFPKVALFMAFIPSNFLKVSTFHTSRYHFISFSTSQVYSPIILVGFLVILPYISLPVSRGDRFSNRSKRLATNLALKPHLYPYSTRMMKFVHLHNTIAQSLNPLRRQACVFWNKHNVFCWIFLQLYPYGGFVLLLSVIVRCVHLKRDTLRV